MNGEIRVKIGGCETGVRKSGQGGRLRIGNMSVWERVLVRRRRRTDSVRTRKDRLDSVSGTVLTSSNRDLDTQNTEGGSEVTTDVRT